MVINLYLWALLLCVTVRSGGMKQCFRSSSSGVNLSIISQRNQSGHWTVSARNDQMIVLNDNTSHISPRKFTVEINSCKSVDTVFLTTTVTVEPTFDGDLYYEMPLEEGGEKINVPSKPSPQLPSSSGTTARGPPFDYEFFQGLGYYKMHTEALPWLNARDKCIEEGAHLIIIDSQEEAKVIKTFFARKPKIQNTVHRDGVHIGFHDRVSEGLFITVLGEPLNSSEYNRWFPGTPNGGTRDNCGSASKDAELYDFRCSHKQAFICEYINK